MAKRETVKRKRPERVMVAFTPGELKAIDEKAKKVGLVISAYIRQLTIVAING